MIYRGPRPELVVSLPFPVSDLVTDPDDTVRQGPDGTPIVVRYDFTTTRRFWKPLSVHLLRDVPNAHVPGLFALGLDAIARKPSPWFDVRVDVGEMNEVQARLKAPMTRAAVLRFLGWSVAQIGEVYAGEQKLMTNADGEILYAPPGWRPLPA